MKALSLYCSLIDRINEGIGKVVAWGMVVIAVFITLEVILRYFFDSPTIWVWDSSIYLIFFVVMLSSGYVVKHGSHVAVDMFSIKLSEKSREVLFLITGTVFFLVVITLIWQGIAVGYPSLIRGDTMATIWGPPLYPLRMIIPIGACLMLLQGIAEAIRSIVYLSTQQRI